MLIRSMDRKTTNSLSVGGNPNIKNTFGLPAGNLYSCPGMTNTCEKVCYVNKIVRIYAGVVRILKHNWDQLQFTTTAEAFNLLDQMMTEFEQECDRKGADKFFRFHWSGDLFNASYARAISKVVKAHPNTQFWIYTRSLNYIKYINDIDNLSVYVSADSDNIVNATEVANKYNVQMAVLGDTFDTAADLTTVRTPRCPENNRSLVLTGACKSCMLCVNGTADVLFSATKR